MKIIFNYRDPINAALVFRQYDTINLPIEVVYVDDATGVETDFDFTGYDILVQFRRMDGLLNKVLRSYVSPAEIAVSGNVLTLGEEAFDTVEFLTYDIKIFNSTEQYRIVYGYAKVEKSATD